MSDTRQVHFNLDRQPHGIKDLGDLEAVRAWALELVAGLTIRDGRLTDVVRYLLEPYEEVMAVAGLVELGQENLLAVMLRSLAAREGVQHYFRHAEVLLTEEGADKGRRHAVLLGVTLPWEDEAEPRWWLARRAFGTAAGGVGVFHGDWRIEEGMGLEALPEELQEWLDTRKAEVTGVSEATIVPRDPKDFDVRMAVLDPPKVMPETALQLAQAIGRSLDREVLSQGMSAILLFVLRSDALERWELRGEPPCTLDDAIRGILDTGEALGLTLTTAGAVSLPDGQSCRAIHTIAEHSAEPGVRARRMLALKVGEGGRFEPYLEGQDSQALEEGEGWLGVAPNPDVSMFVMGMVGSDEVGDA